MTTDPFDDLFEGYDGPESSPAATQAVYRSMQPGLQQSRTAHRRRVAGGWILATALLAGSPIAIGYVTDSAPTEVDVSDSSVSTPDDGTEPVAVDDQGRDEDSDDVGDDQGTDPEERVETVDDAGGEDDEGDQTRDGDTTSDADDGDSSDDEADSDDDAEGDDDPGDSSDVDPDEPDDVDDLDGDDDADADEPDDEDDPDSDEDDDPVEVGSRLPVTTTAGSVTAVVLADGTIDFVDITPAPGYTPEIELRGDEARITFSHETEDEVKVEFEIEHGELVADIDDDTD